MSQKYKHTFDQHFMQLSLTADYGTFVCEKCKNTFHHSPSTIKLDGIIVYNYACGYCTNEIIKRDWQEEPYTS